MRSGPATCANATTVMAAVAIAAPASTGSHPIGRQESHAAGAASTARSAARTATASTTSTTVTTTIGSQPNGTPTAPAATPVMPMIA